VCSGFGDNYRNRANECIEVADRAADLERKRALLDLAQRWLWLATQTDAIADRNELRSDALLDHSDMNADSSP
jgi:hypothetical protein